MSSIYKSLSELLSPFLIGRPKRVIIEEWSFRLHFQATSIFLLLFSALLCMREYVGEHIKCQTHHEDDSDDPTIPRKVLETYCFIQTTFTIPYDLQKSSVSKIRNDINLGGSQYLPGVSNRTHHAYYQWVPFFLFFLAIYFQITHMLWKSVDNGKIKSIVDELRIKKLEEMTDGNCPGRFDKIHHVAKYISDSEGSHSSWAFVYFLSESLNVVIVGSALFYTDKFLGNEFSSYGTKVLQFIEEDPEKRIDPMAIVFPKITKCLFHMYGPSGSLQRFDALCLLPSNILNEKIFTFLWFWFAIVAIVSLFGLIHRIAMLISPKLRLYSLVGSGLSSTFPLSPQNLRVLRRTKTADWLLLRFLKLNLDSETFRRLLKAIYE